MMAGTGPAIRGPDTPPVCRWTGVTPDVGCDACHFGLTRTARRRAGLPAGLRRPATALPPFPAGSTSSKTLALRGLRQFRHGRCNVAGMTTIGLIANPVSARDIRRIIANASNLQIADRVNIVMRVLTAAHSLGVERVLVMPDNGGIRALLQRTCRAGTASTSAGRWSSTSTWSRRRRWTTPSWPLA